MDARRMWLHNSCFPALGFLHIAYRYRPCPCSLLFSRRLFGGNNLDKAGIHIYRDSELAPCGLILVQVFNLFNIIEQVICDDLK